MNENSKEDAYEELKRLLDKGLISHAEMREQLSVPVFMQQEALRHTLVRAGIPARAFQHEWSDGPDETSETSLDPVPHSPHSPLIPDPRAAEERWRQLLIDALATLEDARLLLERNVFPQMRLPMPRFFSFGEGRIEKTAVTWPKVEGNVVFWGRCSNDLSLTNHGDRIATARVLMRLANQRPRRVLRTLRRIEAASAWCYARHAGMERSARRLLEGQRRAIETLGVYTAYDQYARD